MQNEKLIIVESDLECFSVDPSFELQHIDITDAQHIHELLIAELKRSDNARQTSEVKSVCKYRIQCDYSREVDQCLIAALQNHLPTYSLEVVYLC